MASFLKNVFHHWMERANCFTFFWRIDSLELQKKFGQLVSPDFSVQRSSDNKLMTLHIIFHIERKEFAVIREDKKEIIMHCDVQEISGKMSMEDIMASKSWIWKLPVLGRVKTSKSNSQPHWFSFKECHSRKDALILVFRLSKLQPGHHSVCSFLNTVCATWPVELYEKNEAKNFKIWKFLKVRIIMYEEDVLINLEMSRLFGLKVLCRLVAMEEEEKELYSWTVLNDQTDCWPFRGFLGAEVLRKKKLTSINLKAYFYTPKNVIIATESVLKDKAVHIGKATPYFHHGKKEELSSDAKFNSLEKLSSLNGKSKTQSLPLNLNIKLKKYASSFTDVTTQISKQTPSEHERERCHTFSYLPETYHSDPEENFNIHKDSLSVTKNICVGELYQRNYSDDSIYSNSNSKHLDLFKSISTSLKSAEAAIQCSNETETVIFKNENNSSHKDILSALKVQKRDFIKNDEAIQYDHISNNQNVYKINGSNNLCKTDITFNESLSGARPKLTHQKTNEHKQKDIKLIINKGAACSDDLYARDTFQSTILMPAPNSTESSLTNQFNPKEEIKNQCRDRHKNREISSQAFISVLSEKNEITNVDQNQHTKNIYKTNNSVNENKLNKSISRPETAENKIVNMKQKEDNHNQFVDKLYTMKIPMCSLESHFNSTHTRQEYNQFNDNCWKSPLSLNSKEKMVYQTGPGPNDSKNQYKSKYENIYSHNNFIKQSFYKPETNIGNKTFSSTIPIISHQTIFQDSKKSEKINNEVPSRDKQHNMKDAKEELHIKTLRSKKKSRSKLSSDPNKEPLGGLTIQNSRRMYPKRISKVPKMEIALEENDQKMETALEGNDQKMEIGLESKMKLKMFSQEQLQTYLKEETEQNLLEYNNGCKNNQEEIKQKTLETQKEFNKKHEILMQSCLKEHNKASLSTGENSNKSFQDQSIELEMIKQKESENGQMQDLKSFFINTNAQNIYEYKNNSENIPENITVNKASETEPKTSDFQPLSRLINSSDNAIPESSYSTTMQLTKLEDDNIIYQHGKDSLQNENYYHSVRNMDDYFESTNDDERQDDDIESQFEYDPCTFDRLKKFCDTGSLDELNFEETCELFSAAHVHGILDLQRSCSLLLASEVEVSNACYLLLLADAFQDDSLKIEVLYFIHCHQELLFSDAWRNLVEQDSNLAADTISFLLSKAFDVQ